MCTATRFSSNTVQWSKFGFAAHFFSGFWLLTNRIFTRLRIFSIVLPKTLLFMSLKKSFSNSFCALGRRFVFNSMYGFNHAFSSKEIPRWIFVSFKPRSKYCFKFLWWRTYLFFSFKFGISFSTLLISIRSEASGIHCANHEASLGIPSQLQEYILSPLDQKILSNFSNLSSTWNLS